MKIVYVVLAFTLALFGACDPAEPRGCVDIEHERVFADVPFDHAFCVEIEAMWRDGLTTGCRIDDDGTRYFCPDEPLTRAQGAAFAEHRDPFAQIDLDGKISIGDHVRNAGRHDVGIYWVQFNRNISHGCSMESWSHDWNGPAVRVDAILLWGAVDTVLIETSVRGIPKDMWFNVRIHCR